MARHHKSQRPEAPTLAALGIVSTSRLLSPSPHRLLLFSLPNTNIQHSKSRTSQHPLANSCEGQREGSTKTSRLNQSIKGPHKATHGPRRSHIPAPPQGGQTLHHKPRDSRPQASASGSQELESGTKTCHVSLSPHPAINAQRFSLAPIRHSKPKASQHPLATRVTLATPSHQCSMLNPVSPG